MTNNDDLAVKLKAAADKATKGDWRRASTRFNGITATPFSLGGEEKMLASTSEKCDAEFITTASPTNILSLLAERTADKAENASLRQRVAELEEIADLQRDKIKRLESALWDEQQLRKVHSEKSFELEKEYRELKHRNDEDFIWRGEEIVRLNDELDALKEKLAAAGIKLEVGE